MDLRINGVVTLKTLQHIYNYLIILLLHKLCLPWTLLYNMYRAEYCDLKVHKIYSKMGEISGDFSFQALAKPNVKCIHCT